MVERFVRFSLAISEISRCWHKLAAEEMAAYGLRGAHAIYLTTMYRCGGVTGPQLCELCGRDKSDVSRTVAILQEKGFVTTMFGRRRQVPELKSSNFMQRSFGERVAMNAPIQGTAADIMKIAMIGVERHLLEEGLKSRLVLQVHDELLVEAWKPELDTVKGILKEEMEQAAKLSVPLEIDMHTGTNWYEAK